MATCLSRRQLRRAAAVTLLLSAIGSRPVASFAQQFSDYDSTANGYVVSDGGSSNFGSYENGVSRNDSFNSCDNYCSEQGECNSDCAPCFNDGYKHYCPVWVGAEWIHWRLDGNRLPPLVTDGPVTTSIATVARLSDPGTRILSGDETVNDNWRDGYRLFGGVWLDCCRTCGVGVDYFDAGEDDYSFTSENDPTRVVGRPFFDTQLGTEGLQLVSVPGELEGTVRVKSSDDFRGGGVTF